jgi:hypothetical protein
VAAEDAMTVKPDRAELAPEAQLRSLIDRHDPQQQKLIRAVRAVLRKRIPAANELVYDYGHSVVISYSPTERGMDAIVSIAARADRVDLYFNHGPQLPDPEKLLRGSAKQTRFIEIEAARQLAKPGVEALIGAAIDLVSAPLPSGGKGRLIIRPTAASKRSGKPAK